jgi:hypothetical protein
MSTLEKEGREREKEMGRAGGRVSERVFVW